MTIEAFTTAVEDFFNWVHSESSGSEDDLIMARDILSRLIAFVTAIEAAPKSAEIDGPETSMEATGALFNRRFKDFPISLHWLALEPLNRDGSELGASIVTGDLAEIYEDLYEGYHLFKDGHLDDAVFAWDITYFHWGEHAITALRAIEDYRTENMIKNQAAERERP